MHISSSSSSSSSSSFLFFIFSLFIFLKKGFSTSAGGAGLDPGTHQLWPRGLPQPGPQWSARRGPLPPPSVLGTGHAIATDCPSRCRGCSRVHRQGPRTRSAYHVQGSATRKGVNNGFRVKKCSLGVLKYFAVLALSSIHRPFSWPRRLHQADRSLPLTQLVEEVARACGDVATPGMYLLRVAANAPVSHPHEVCRKREWKVGVFSRNIYLINFNLFFVVSSWKICADDHLLLC